MLTARTLLSGIRIVLLCAFVVTIPAGIFSVTMLTYANASVVLPDLPRAYVDTSYVSTPCTTIVPPDGDLQGALDTAAYGDTVCLTAGALYTGNFRIKQKVGDGWIVVRTSTPDNEFPLPGNRVQPSDAPKMAKIVSPNSQGALNMDAGAKGWRFIGLEMTVDPTVTRNSAIVRMTVGQQVTTLEDIPAHIIIDRSYIHGHAQCNCRVGVILDVMGGAIVDSRVSDIHEVGADSQAVLIIQTPGPSKVVNNFLEAAGENLMLGGGDPKITNMLPEDIDIRGNYFSKPLSWRIEDASYAGIPWTVKNLLELKLGRRVRIDGNIFNNDWAHGQAGDAIVFKSANQIGTAPWSETSHVTFENNIVRHASGGMHMAATGGAGTAKPLNTVRLHNNLFDDLNASSWGKGGGGYFLQIDNRINALAVDHNTVIQTGGTSALSFYGDLTLRGSQHAYTNNLGFFRTYGVKGSGVEGGTATLNAYLSGWVFENNALIGKPSNIAPSLYPATTLFPSDVDAVGFESFNNGNEGDYRLNSFSPYKNAATDGKDIGADMAAIYDMTACVVTGITVGCDSSTPPLCVQISLEKQKRHQLSDVTITVKDQIVGERILTTNKASDAQGKILLSDPALDGVSAGKHFIIGVKPRGFLKTVLRDVDILSSRGDECLVFHVNLLGDLNGNGLLEVADLIEAIGHYIGTKVHPALQEVFGQNFRLSNVMDCIRNFVNKAEDAVE